MSIQELYRGKHTVKEEVAMKSTVRSQTHGDLRQPGDECHFYYRTTSGQQARTTFAGENGQDLNSLIQW